MGLRPLVLIVPSMAAAVELPRRLASTGRAVTGLYPFRLPDLARAIAEPFLLGRGLKPWDHGHAALVGLRLLSQPHRLRLSPGLPLPTVAAALARTLTELRSASIAPGRLEALAESVTGAEDQERLRAMSALREQYEQAVEGRFADPATLFRAAREHLAEAPWLEGAEVLVVEDLELDAVERDFLDALSRAVQLRRLERDRPPSLHAGSFAAWAAGRGIQEVSWPATPLAPLAPPPASPGIERLRMGLFEPAGGEPVTDSAVELLTAAGEAAEVRSVVRRLLREAARGVPFEEMGVILPRPVDYAPLFTEMLERLRVPYRLHPSLPLVFGRAARSLLLLLRCRGLSRTAVMEFLTFAPVPFAELLGDGPPPRPAQWDAISRDAGIVSGLARWMIGLRAYAEAEREAAQKERPGEGERVARRRERAAEAESLLRIVELLSGTLDALSGEASWPEWSARLRDSFDQWISGGTDRPTVLDVLADLGGLGFAGPRAPWPEVESVLQTRFERERLPLEPREGGAVHVGALDAVAGLPFRVVAITGLVEGGYPGVLRPDPFLVDRERGALNEPVAQTARAVAPAPSSRVRTSASAQLSFGWDEEPGPPRPSSGPGRPVGASPMEPGPPALATTQDRLREQRRLFHRALGQATERLILSYPRADPRTGRERMPSLFFVAAASALAGRPLAGSELERRVVEDDLDSLALEDTLDRSERDRVRVRRDGEEAALAIAAGSSFFKQSLLAGRARWSNEMTAYDGRVAFRPGDEAQGAVSEEVRRKLDPVTAGWPLSASRLATFSTCGFQYLLKYVLRLEAALEPEERKRLEPLERGTLFHEVAERFLRERRERGELPLVDSPEMRARLEELANESLEALVAGSPPRFGLLWERERSRFHSMLAAWFTREARNAGRAVPAYFEVGFGPIIDPAPGEPHSPEPLVIDLGDGRALAISGKIDRIDRRTDGGLVLRDYKTGRAPKDEGGVFRGARQLQIPFYILASAKLFPDEPVVEAFLDFVDGGRQFAMDPRSVTGEEFRALLRGLVDAIAQGTFLQEPSACDWCDYTAVCGPRPLLERRRRHKLNDPRVRQILRLRDAM